MKAFKERGRDRIHVLAVWIHRRQFQRSWTDDIARHKFQSIKVPERGVGQCLMECHKAARHFLKPNHIVFVPKGVLCVREGLGRRQRPPSASGCAVSIKDALGGDYLPSRSESHGWWWKWRRSVNLYNYNFLDMDLPRSIQASVTPLRGWAIESISLRHPCSWLYARGLFLADSSHAHSCGHCPGLSVETSAVLI